MARWLERLTEYDYVVVHSLGPKLSNADVLSRNLIRGVQIAEMWLHVCSVQEFAAAQDEIRFS